jgi:membrane associated rhomboid family serine protease
VPTAALKKTGREYFEELKWPLSALGLMWCLAVADLVLRGWLSNHGVIPRRQDGLIGIVWWPWLHAGFVHLMGNTLPFVGLSALLAGFGRGVWLKLTLLLWIGGGALLWLAARPGNHLGASGLVFGYLGYLLFRAVAERKLSSILIAVAAAVLYGGLLLQLVRIDARVSMEAHLYCFVLGSLAASWKRLR